MRNMRLFWLAVVVACLAGAVLLRPTRAEAGGGGKLVVVDAGGSAWLSDGRNVWRWEDGWVLTTRYLTR